MAFLTVRPSTSKCRAINEIRVPWASIPAASAAIFWYTGVVGGSPHLEVEDVVEQGSNALQTRPNSLNTLFSTV